MMHPRYALTVLFLLAACATTPTEWVRADTSVAQRDRDDKACRQIGSDRAYEESMSSKPLYPPWTGTGFEQNRSPWMPGYETRSPSYFQRGPRMGELYDYCMRERGYRLQALRQ